MQTRHLYELFSGTLLAALLLVGCGPIGGGGGGGNGHPTGGEGCATFADEYGSEITEDTTVTPGSCLKVDEPITVSSGQLTIESGVTLFFAELAALSVQGQGALTTKGSSSSRVVLTGQTETPGAWMGVKIASDSSLNGLEQTTIAYAGAAEDLPGLSLTDGAKVAVDNTTIRQSGDDGLKIGQKTELSSFSNNTFEQNTGAPIVTHPQAIAQLDSSAVFADNGESLVRVLGGVVSEGEGSWPGMAVPYQVNESVRIQGEETKVTVEPGATFEFAEQTYLAVRGAVFVVAGTADNKVTFTGTNETKGWWIGLVMQDTARAGNKIEHAIIEYAGHEKEPFSASFCLHCVHNPSNLQLVGNRGAVKVALNNVTIRAGSEAGMFADDGVELTSFQNNELTGNDEGSALIHALVIADLETSNTFGSAVRVTGGTVNDGEESLWPAINADYVAEGNIEVRGAETTVTVEAGATFKFAEQKHLAIEESVFVAKGTADNKVTFQGTQPMKGWWSGVIFQDTARAANLLEHVVIEHGGNQKGPFRAAFCLHCEHHPSNLQLHGQRGSVTLTMKNVELRASSAAGLYADSDVSFGECADVSIAECGTDVAGDISRVSSTCSL